MSNYEFAGIGHAEAADRCDEYHTGVASLGDGQSLLEAPAPTSRSFLNKVGVANTGAQAAILRLRHQGSVKTVAAEILSAFNVAGNRFAGKLQYRALTPGSLVITEGGALADVVDDGAGVLHDIGIPANVRGSVNYTTGVIDMTWGAGATAPVTIAYTHTDAMDFASVQQSNAVVPAGSYPEALATSIGRVNPGSVSLTDGAEVFVDDGKGNMVETTGGIATVRGTIDYGTGAIALTGGSGVLANPVTITYTYNPFASLLNAGGTCGLFDMYNSQIPELTSEPWADGVKGESLIVLWGESRSATQTSLLTKWYHAGSDPFRVNAPFSGFPAGGHDNDPSL